MSGMGYGGAGSGTLLGKAGRPSLGNKWELGSMGFEAVHASLQC